MNSCELPPGFRKDSSGIDRGSRSDGPSDRATSRRFAGTAFSRIDLARAAQLAGFIPPALVTTLRPGWSRKIGVSRRTLERAMRDAAEAGTVMLETGRSGTRLAVASEPSRVDDAAVKSLAQRVDAVVASLQKDADGAIARGEVVIIIGTLWKNPPCQTR